MELADGVLLIGPFMAVTTGIIVLFVGKRLNDYFHILKDISIPEPVTGGLLFSFIFTLAYLVTGIPVEFDLSARDILLVYFFTTIGLNAQLKDLLAGGKTLIILLAITISYMVLQNLTGITVASLFGLPSAVGVIGGSVSLIGGHGTTIAWGPRIASGYGIANAVEIGIACATSGLVLASLMGGPIAKMLINRYNLEPDETGPQDIGMSEKDTHTPISSLDFLDAVLAIHMSQILGFFMNEILEESGLQLPLFVTCLFAGILLTSIMPQKLPRLITGTRWPSRTQSMALIADVALGTFLAMSLMSMQLWTLVDLAAPILSILLAQFAVAVMVITLIVFPVMGRDYNAAVISAGIGGISLGATPTAMANMAAVTQRYGPSHIAFVVVPLVGSFFIDITNALMIPYFLEKF